MLIVALNEDFPLNRECEGASRYEGARGRVRSGGAQSPEITIYRGALPVGGEIIFLYSLGLTPLISLKNRLKFDRLLKPQP